MNEKYLWQLWEKCKHPHPKYGGDDMVWPMEFAELIVAECLSIVDEEGCGEGGSVRAMEKIREHFGVTE